MLVEASRSVPRNDRHPALIVESFGGTSLIHTGLAAIGKSAYQPYVGDARELASRGLIRLELISQSTYSAEATNEGVRYYEQMRAAKGQPVERVEIQMRNYLTADDFGRRHPASLAKWQQAESALWSTDSAREMTTIGHLCREAIQDFATEALGPDPDVNTDPNIQRTLNRMRAAIKARLTSDSVREFADALLSYWKAVNDLAQRQEHRASTEGQSLSWEDARRVVFHTLVVMHEIDRALSSK